MTKALTKQTEQTSLVLPQERYALAKEMAAKGATDAEFEILIHMSNKYGLDPLAKEIWCIKRKPGEAASIMTSRDGYLTIAHRSGQFDGIKSWCTYDDNKKPVTGHCIVYRKDMSHPFEVEVPFNEYNAGSYVWQKYPSAMIIKVAEVFTLKRAFSISGMVTQEEIGDVEEQHDARPAITTTDKALEYVNTNENGITYESETEMMTEEQLETISDYLSELESVPDKKTGKYFTIDQFWQGLEKKHGPRTNWTHDQAESIIDTLLERLEK